MTLRPIFSSKAGMLAGPDGSPPLVLVVENEAVLALELETIINDAGGLAIGPAATASQAVRLAATVRPDVIVMNVALPDGVDGVTAASLIREFHPAPIVFVAAVADAQMREHIVELGGKLVLKPVDSGILVQAIHEAVSRLRGTEREPE